MTDDEPVAMERKEDMFPCITRKMELRIISKREFCRK